MEPPDPFPSLTLLRLRKGKDRNPCLVSYFYWTLTYRPRTVLASPDRGGFGEDRSSSVESTTGEDGGEGVEKNLRT